MGQRETRQRMRPMLKCFRTQLREARPAKRRRPSLKTKDAFAIVISWQGLLVAHKLFAFVGRGSWLNRRDSWCGHCAGHHNRVQIPYLECEGAVVGICRP